MSAAETEAAAVDQVRALLRQPEVVVGTWLAARAEVQDLTEGKVRDALARLDPLWGELFPAEQARVIRALVERMVVGPAGADIRLRVEGLAGLVRDLTAIVRGAEGRRMTTATRASRSGWRWPSGSGRGGRRDHGSACVTVRGNPRGR